MQLLSKIKQKTQLLRNSGIHTSGRLDRSTYVSNVITSAILLLVIVPAAVATKNIEYAYYHPFHPPFFPNNIYMTKYSDVLITLLFPIFMWLIFAIFTQSIRRLHDLGKSGAYVWLLFIPIVGQILFYFLLSKSGNNIDNKYNTLSSFFERFKSNSLRKTEILSYTVSGLLVGFMFICWMFKAPPIVPEIVDAPAPPRAIYRPADMLNDPHYLAEIQLKAKKGDEYAKIGLIQLATVTKDNSFESEDLESLTPTESTCDEMAEYFTSMHKPERALYFNKKAAEQGSVANMRKLIGYFFYEKDYSNYIKYADMLAFTTLNTQEYYSRISEPGSDGYFSLTKFYAEKGPGLYNPIMAFKYSLIEYRTYQSKLYFMAMSLYGLNALSAGTLFYLIPTLAEPNQYFTKIKRSLWKMTSFFEKH